MSEAGKKATDALVAVCAHLAMSVTRDPNFTIWVGVLREIMPDCEDVPDAVLPLRAAANDLAFAQTASLRENALARLKFDAAMYYQGAAASRYDVWRAHSGRSRT